MVEDTPYRSAPTPLSVGALVRGIRDLLEHGLPVVRVIGEISNLMMARSGHWYFVLKDADAQIRSVMFRHRNALVAGRIAEGMKVEAVGVISVYEPRGDLQLNVESLRPAGRGSLFEEFLRLRDRLQAEGMFDESLKRKPPDYPNVVGIVTSPQAAALQDVLRTLRRRDPRLSVVIYPSQVQGDRAGDELVRALELAGRRGECDVLLLVRGGGSIEDLWGFNDEGLARAIRACPIPVIAGVGHETDFTIADFVADLRAPTPTAAAELAARPASDLQADLAALVRRLSRDMRHRVARSAQHLDHLQRRVGIPRRLLDTRRTRLQTLSRTLAGAALNRARIERGRLDGLTRDLRRLVPDVRAKREAARRQVVRLVTGIDASLRERRRTLDAMIDALRHLDPESVLSRGYSITRNAAGAIVRDPRQVHPDDLLEITLEGGRISARTLKTLPPRTDAALPVTE